MEVAPVVAVYDPRPFPLVAAGCDRRIRRASLVSLDGHRPPLHKGEQQKLLPLGERLPEQFNELHDVRRIIALSPRGQRQHFRAVRRQGPVTKPRPADFL